MRTGTITKIRHSEERTVCPISGTSRFIVTIDGEPYASFLDRFYAEQAVRMWLGEIDGAGLPIPYEQQTSRAWRGIRGRKVTIVER